MRLTTDLFEYCHERVPQWNTISISGYHIREKGCSAVQEVAFTLVHRASPTCRRRSTRASTSTTSRRASRSSSTATTTSSRRSPSSAPRGACGRTSCASASAPRTRKSTMLRFHTQTGGVHADRAAAREQHRARRPAGLRRRAAAAPSRCTPTASTRRSRCRPSAPPRSRCAPSRSSPHESGAADTVDPFAGSYFVESLTDEIEARAQRADRRRSTRSAARCSAIEFITRRDRRVGLGLPGALPDRPGHRRRRQQVRGGRHRRPGPAARRPASPSASRSSG